MHYLLIFHNKTFLLCFYDYVNNTYLFKNIHTIPRNMRKVEIIWNANTTRWLLLTFDELFFHEIFICIEKNIFFKFMQIILQCCLLNLCAHFISVIILKMVYICCFVSFLS